MRSMKTPIPHMCSFTPDVAGQGCCALTGTAPGDGRCGDGVRAAVKALDEREPRPAVAAEGPPAPLFTPR